MARTPMWRRYLTFWGRDVEADLQEEMAFHLAARTQELVDRGWPADAAAAEARRAFGDGATVFSECVRIDRRFEREMRVSRWLDELKDDVRFALRTLKASPTFTAGAALTLALAIGANGAIFALADATLLRPVPFPDPHQLVMVWERTPTSPRSVVAPFEFDLWTQRNRAFTALAAITPGSRAVNAADGTAEQIPVQTVSTRLFDVLDVKPIIGRTFLPSDDHPDADAVVLSEGFWRSRFGADAAVVGRQIEMDGKPVTIVGVVPAGAQILTPSSAWTVLTTGLMRSPVGVHHSLRVVGRLRPDQTMDAARADMDAVAATIAREVPELNKDRGVTLDSLDRTLIGADLQFTSMLLVGVVALILLAGCANIANLLLVRTSVRSREFTVRAALGAGRRRLIRQLLTESLVLGAIGGILGAAIAAASLRMAPSLLPQGLLPITVDLVLNWRVVAFCAALSFVVAVVFGVVPAWQATAGSLVQGMASGSRVTTGRGARFRGFLAISEIAAAMLLLCGAGLLLRSLLALDHLDPGHGAEQALTMNVNFPFAAPGTDSRFVSPESRWRFFEDVEREVGQLASVQSVAWGSAMPLDGWQMAMGFDLAGAPPRPEAMKDMARYHTVSASYFRTLEIPVLRGRDFDERDRVGGVPVCIVNEEFARRFLSSGDPVGQRLVIRGLTTGAGPLPVREIVGVVRQVLERPGEIEAQPHVYVPLAQDPGFSGFLVVRPRRGEAGTLTSEVRAAVARIDKTLPVGRVRTLARIEGDATARPRFRAVIVGAFAALALGLGVLGTFAVTAYSVQQRLREFGVRIALGATVPDVIRIVATGAARLTVFGIAVGLAGVVVLSRWISSFLFGIPALDAITLGSAATILLLTVLLATLAPALRAARTDAAVVFRSE